MTEWLIAALPYIGSGVVGSAATYGATYVRERRRTLDAYRSPQRQAIGDVAAANYQYQVRLFNVRRDLSELLDAIGQGNKKNVLAHSAQFRLSIDAHSVALFDLRRALDIGSITVVDSECWAALARAAAVVTRVTEIFDGSETPGVARSEELHNRIGLFADELANAVTALVQAATRRVAPTESCCNRRRREAVRRRLAAELRPAPDSEQPQP